MKLVIITLLLACSLGCAVARAPKRAYQKAYCTQMSQDGKHCLAWGTHNYDCVHDVYGDCQK